MFLSSSPSNASSSHGHDHTTTTANNTPGISTPLQTPTLYSVASFPRSTLTALFAAATRQSTTTPPPEREDAPQDDPQDASTDPTPEVSRSPTLSSAESVSETKSRKRISRAKTCYSLCHPPPHARKKGKLHHSKPKVLLQLRQVSQSSRPKPAFEVAPSVRCSSKLVSRSNPIFRATDKLGPDDVVVLRAAEYGKHRGGESSEEDGHEQREAIGAICSSGTKQALATDICMDDGLVWRASQTPNGNYEFETVDEHGLRLKARWVARMPRRRTGSSDLSATGGAVDDKKFIFSTIRPGFRRHPIIASMTKKSIDVMDDYTIPQDLSSQSASATPTPLATPSLQSDSESYMESRKAESAATFKTDEPLRKLIIVTAVWVAFRESWSSVFHYATSPTVTTNFPPLDGAPVRPGNHRAVSMPPIDSKGSSRSSTPEDGHRGVPKMLRSSSNLFRRQSGSSTAPSITSTSPSSPSSPVSTLQARTRRSNSIETGYLKRASTNWRRVHTDALREDSESSLDPEDKVEYAKVPIVQPPAEIKVTAPSFEVGREMLDFPGSPSTPRPEKPPRVMSAYLPPESTKGIWGSGEPERSSSIRSCRGRGQKERPKSYHYEGSEPVVKKEGRLRKLLSSMFRH